MRNVFSLCVAPLASVRHVAASTSLISYMVLLCAACNLNDQKSCQFAACAVIKSCFVILQMSFVQPHFPTFHQGTQIANCGKSHWCVVHSLSQCLAPYLGWIQEYCKELLTLLAQKCQHSEKYVPLWTPYLTGATFCSNYHMQCSVTGGPVALLRVLEAPDDFVCSLDLFLDRCVCWCLSPLLATYQISCLRLRLGQSGQSKHCVVCYLVHLVQVQKILPEKVKQQVQQTGAMTRQTSLNSVDIRCTSSTECMNWDALFYLRPKVSWTGSFCASVSGIPQPLAAKGHCRSFMEDL